MLVVYSQKFNRWVFNLLPRRNNMSKVQWKNVYYPAGQWVDEEGNKITISGNFKCKHNKVDLICVMHSAEGGGGHGDPRFSAEVPSFINATTYQPVVVDGFIEINI